MKNQLLYLSQTGPNRTPVAAICLTSLLTMAFIFIGQVNVLAPIVTINFMLTYSFIDYSYFSVAMTYQLQSHDRRETLILARRSQRRSIRQSSTPLIEAPFPNYGSGGGSPQSKGTLLEFAKDMDQIFPPDSSVDAKVEKTFSVVEPRSRGKSRKATAKQKLMDSFGLDLNSNMSPDERSEDISSAPPYEEPEVQCGSEEPRAGEEPQVECCPKTSRVEQDSSADPPSHSTGHERCTSNFTLDWRSQRF